MNLIDELNDFINKTKDAREIKRAMAVKMKLSGKSSRQIEELLQLEKSCNSGRSRMFDRQL